MRLYVPAGCDRMRGSREIVDRGLDLSGFDPEIASELSRFPFPDLSQRDVGFMRRAYDDYFRGVRARSTTTFAGVSSHDLSVPSLVDGHEIPIRIYRSAGSRELGGFVYFHGGGFCVGGLESEEERCLALASGGGCAVISVDYRLAPEHPFPIPLEDCHSALSWISRNGLRFGIDPDRLAVGGCSAGGALAASLAQMCRDTGGPHLRLLALYYAVLDASSSAQSLDALAEDEALDIRQMWGRYLGASSGEYASPAAMTDLSGLPPTYLAVADCDVFRDEVLSYATRLLTAGVVVELHLWPRAPHAFDLYVPNASISQEAMKEQGAALARALQEQSVPPSQIQ